MADPRIQRESLAGGVPNPQIPLPRGALFDGDERRNVCGPRGGVLHANVDGLEETERADALLRALDRAPPERLAWRVADPPPDDSIVHTPVAHNVDRAEKAAADLRRPE